jgi:hypothetical protein
VKTLKGRAASRERMYAVPSMTSSWESMRGETTVLHCTSPAGGSTWSRVHNGNTQAIGACLEMRLQEAVDHGARRGNHRKGHDNRKKI